MDKKKFTSFFSKDSKPSRSAKNKLKQILFRLSMPRHLTTEEKLMVESLVDDIINAKLIRQVELLENFQQAIVNTVRETLREERIETLNKVQEMIDKT